MDSCDFVRYPSGFLLCVVGGIADDFVALTKRRPQFLRLAVFVFRDHRVRRVEDGLRRTVILFEHDGFGVREILFEVLDVTDVRTSERVDGLVGITHHGNPARSHTARSPRLRVGLFVRIDAGQFTYEHILGMVGVLILVHEDVTEPVPIVFAHLRAGLEQFHGAHDQIVEVDCVGERQTMLVFGVDDGDQFVDVAGAHLVSALSRDVIAVRFFQLVFPGNQRVLAVGYLAQQHAWRIPLRIDVQVGCDQFDQSLAVRGVVNREARFKADFLAVAA